MPQKVLVVGGAGFIGSRLTTLLCDLDFEVLVLDDLSFGYKHLVDQRAKFLHGSMRDISSFAQQIAGCEVAFLLAAKSIIETSFTNPLSYIETNIVELSTCILGLRLIGVQQVIFSSSAAVYGIPDVPLIIETHQKMPITVYGATKSAAEELLSAFWSAFQINSVALRYFNAYGPNDLQQPVSRAVPAWIRDGLRGRALTVYWEGQQVRDYVYVDDVARAHVSCMGLIGHHRFNVGSGTGIPMMKILRLIEQNLNTSFNIIDAGNRPGDPGVLVASNTAIKASTGWAPLIDIESGLDLTVSYYKQLLDSGKLY